MDRMLTLIALALTATTSAAAERTMLVLDVSGSMWGQIEGITKIEIARDAVASLVEGWTDDAEVGLVAYGHRRKGDCSDIEVMVEAGPLDAAAMKATVNGLTPKGRTPLSDAVILAAEAIRYTEDKATVVLVSDGVETCERDPCAVGAELEKLGIDFTAHVIGFDVGSVEDQAGLRCLAENTGGRFISADNAGELVKALEQTVRSVAPEPLPEGRLESADSVVKGTEFEVLPGSDTGDVGGYVYLFAAGAERHATYGYVRYDGGYQPIILRMPAVAGDYELRWLSKDSRVIAARPIAASEPQVSLSAPATVTAGTEVEVTLDAPRGLGGYVYLYPDGSDDSIAYAYAREGGTTGYDPARLRVPAEPGAYVLRWLSPDNQVYAETAFEAVAAAVSIAAPAQAVAGTEIAVALNAPRGLSGYIYLFPGGGGEDIAYAYVREDSAGGYQDAVLRLPNEPGEYDIRWISSNKEELAATTTVAVAAAASIDAANSGVAATGFKVTPVGPSGLGGYINLYMAGGDKAVTYAYVRDGSDGAYQVAELNLPAVAGDYVLKWVSPGKQVIAERPLTIEAPRVSIEAPDTAPAGTELAITINAPGGMDGQVQLFARGGDRHISYNYVREAATGGYQPTSLRLPAAAGDYDIRWYSGRRELIAERPVVVEAVTVGLVAPAEAVMATELDIRLDAPPGLDGQVQLFAPGAKRFAAYAYVREGAVGGYQPASMLLPGVAGDYELRWISKQREVLATAPLRLRAPDLSIDAPPQVAADESFEVAVDGTPGVRGRVQLVPRAGAKAVVSRGVRDGSTKAYDPVKLKAPDTAGGYRLQVVARSGEVLAERSLEVVAK